MAKKRKQPAHKSSFFSRPVSILTIVLFILGATFIGSSVLWEYHRARILSFSSPEAIQPAAVTPAPLPHQLTIPDLTISLPVDPAKVQNNVWETSETNVSYLEGSGVPGQAGNIVLYGHNKASILGNLKRAKIGQVVYLTTTDNTVHFYEIKHIKTVAPTAIEVIQPTLTEVLTIYTCAGLFDSQRLIIQAVPNERAAT